jgi:protein-tyrosine phosphatase
MRRCREASSYADDGVVQGAAALLSRYGGLATRLTPWLYLSGAAPASDADTLRRLNIGLIVNCAGEAVENCFVDGLPATADGSLPAQALSYVTLALRDGPFEDVASLFPLVCDAIERARLGGRAVLLHCHQGVSRSATIALAYIVWAGGISVDVAYAAVRALRPIVSPNAGFMCQLFEWAEYLRGVAAIFDSSEGARSADGGGGAIPHSIVFRLLRLAKGCTLRGPLFGTAIEVNIDFTLSLIRSSVDRSLKLPSRALFSALSSDTLICVNEWLTETFVISLTLWVGSRAHQIDTTGFRNCEEVTSMERIADTVRRELLRHNAIFSPVPGLREMVAASLAAEDATSSAIIETLSRRCTPCPSSLHSSPPDILLEVIKARAPPSHALSWVISDIAAAGSPEAEDFFLKCDSLAPEDQLSLNSGSTGRGATPSPVDRLSESRNSGPGRPFDAAAAVPKLALLARACASPGSSCGGGRRSSLIIESGDSTPIPSFSSSRAHSRLATPVPSPSRDAPSPVQSMSLK